MKTQTQNYQNVGTLTDNYFNPIHKACSIRSSNEGRIKHYREDWMGKTLYGNIIGEGDG